MLTLAQTQKAWESFRHEGHICLINPFDDKIHSALAGYFNDRVLGPETYNVQPKNRRRARFVVRYDWSIGHAQLSENDTHAIVTPPGARGDHPHGLERHYNRFDVLNNWAWQLFVRTVLRLIPPELRYQEGTVALNLYRTFGEVVTGMHSDGTFAQVIYVCNVNGTAGETTLSRAEAPGVITFRQVLPVGGLLIVDDMAMLHNTAPTTGPNPRRDAIVCDITLMGRGT